MLVFDWAVTMLVFDWFLEVMFCGMILLLKAITGFDTKLKFMIWENNSFVLIVLITTRQNVIMLSFYINDSR